MFLESLLRSTEAELIWARNGLQAVDIQAGRNDIDLILMDIRMPEMNGLQATEKIRNSDKDIPIIALTAFAFADDREKSMEAGCTEHLSKPVKIEELKRDVCRSTSGEPTLHPSGFSLKILKLMLPIDCQPE